jgi:hypothetical protein
VARRDDTESVCGIVTGRVIGSSSGPGPAVLRCLLEALPRVFVAAPTRAELTWVKGRPGSGHNGRGPFINAKRFPSVLFRWPVFNTENMKDTRRCTKIYGGSRLAAHNKARSFQVLRAKRNNHSSP